MYLSHVGTATEYPGHSLLVSWIYLVHVPDWIKVAQNLYVLKVQEPEEENQRIHNIMKEIIAQALWNNAETIGKYLHVILSISKATNPPNMPRNWGKGFKLPLPKC